MGVNWRFPRSQDISTKDTSLQDVPVQLIFDEERYQEIVLAGQAMIAELEGAVKATRKATKELRLATNDLSKATQRLEAAKRK